MAETKIEWTDETWNPLRGCRRCSPGCGGAAGEGGCYAEVMAARINRMNGDKSPYQGLVQIGAVTASGGADNGRGKRP